MGGLTLLLFAAVFLAGVIVGGAAGVLVLALCVVQARAEWLIEEQRRCER